MKPTRGLPGSRFAQMPRERKVALGSLTVLLALLGSLMLYQRLNSWQLKPPTVVEQGPTPPGTNSAQGGGGAPEAGTEVATQAMPPARMAPTKLLPPLAGTRTVLQPYVYAYSELFGDFRMHHGVDYQAFRGDSVLAAAEGTVTLVEADPLEGMVVELSHGGGLTTRYGGLGKVMVSLDATVQTGSMIAQVGTPGPATANQGPHLHFEVRLNGESRDPATYLKP